MQPQGYYNLSIDSSSGVTRRKRTGLLHGRTGVPLFLLFLEGLSQKKTWELHSADELHLLMQQAQSQPDRAAWEALVSFFDGEGSCAHVAAFPINLSTDRLQQMVGSEKGLRFRTGIHVLKDYVEYADIISVPQAPILLEGDELKAFYQQLFAMALPLETPFVLVDLPKATSSATLEEWLKGWEYPNAAAFFPWITKGKGAVPPSPLVAAAIQLSDAETGLHEVPANRPIRGKFKPLVSLGAAEVQQSLAARINALVVLPDGSFRIWGAATLTDRLDYNGRFISVRRTSTALKEALRRLCEPYVLDPAVDDLSVLIEGSLHTFLRSVRFLFDKDAKEPFSTVVRLNRTKSLDSIDVDVKYQLGHAVEEMNLSLGIVA